MPDEIPPITPLLLSFSCPVKWESMSGDNGVRKCDQCSCKVQNITGFSKSQVNEILARVDAGESICVAFENQPKPVDVGARVQNDLSTTEYWQYKSNPQWRQIFGSTQASLKPQKFTEWSIALAMSVSLAYFNPFDYPPVLAQEQKKSSKTQQPNFLPAISKTANIQTIPKPTTDKVALGPQEQGLLAGRPAPSSIRDLVNDIVYVQTDLLNVITLAPRTDFARDVQNGFISEQKLESLASIYRLFGPTEQAYKCYRLLVALAEREHASAAHIHSWQKVVGELAPNVFATEIKNFDGLFSAQVYEQAQPHLIEANNIRKNNPELAKILHWSDIANRMDSYQSSSAAASNDYYLNTAFALFQDEKETEEIKIWTQAQRVLALRRFSQLIELADKSAKKEKFRESLDFLARAVTIGNLDSELGKSCNWLAIHQRMAAIDPHLQSPSKEWCLNMASKISEKESH